MHDLHLPLILSGLCLLLFLALPELRRRLRYRGKVPTLQHDMEQAKPEPERNTLAVAGDSVAAAGKAIAPGHGDTDGAAGSGHGQNGTAPPQERQDGNEDEDLLLLHLIAPQGTSWPVGRIAAVLEAAGLFFGDMDIFHYPDPAASGAVLFSVANMREPGTLRPADTKQPAITGLVCFRRLSGDACDARACACMLRASRQCAKRIGATLCDTKMQPLDENAVRALRQRFTSVPRRKRG